MTTPIHHDEDPMDVSRLVLPDVPRVETPRIDRTSLDEFTDQYIETALWSSMDESTESGGEPMDRNYGIEDIAEETLAVMVADCQAFQESFYDHIIEDPSRAGHDFWLTRNGHGAGFFDGDWDQEYRQSGDWHAESGRYSTVGDYLTEMTRPYGSYDLYIGDDGMIHGQ